MEKVEKTIVGGSAAAAVLSFLPWFSVSAAGETVMSANAFGSTEGTLAFIAMLATGGLVIADRAGSLPWDRKVCLLAPLAASALGVLFMLFFSGGGSVNMGGISAGRTFWFYLAVTAMIVAGWHAFRRWQAGTVEQEPPPPEDAAV